MRFIERGEGWLRVGSLLFTTSDRFADAEKNAFILGRDAERAGL